MTDKQEINETGLEIAVIGMSGRFPGARDINEFWNNLKNGVEAIAFFSDEELEEAGIPNNLLKNPGYVKAKAVMEDFDCFDASFFGYIPSEAELLDPQVRIFHECAWNALADAGYDPDSYNRLIGVYAGASANFYWEVSTLLSNAASQMDELSAFLLRDKDFLSTRISFKLDLKGPAITLQATCSTSLVAIDQACRGLLTGICDMALAGGVKVFTYRKTGYVYREGMIKSPDGHNRVFDAAAKGMITGEGIGVVVLKRLEDATADGDFIYCIVKGFAVNNDGVEKAGYTAPAVEGQAEVIRAALQMAEVDVESIGYVETHGTGTPFGDPVEIEALKLAFDTDKKNYCGIGSIKSNIGHLDAAAGVAGFIKVALALKNKQIPPSLHFESPNPKINFQDSPFFVNTGLKEWKSEDPLRAGVSSFGIGGSNAHVVLEEFPGGTRGLAPLPDAHASREHKLILLSAKTESALEQTTNNFVKYLEKNPAINLADAAYTLQVGRKTFSYRRMAVCSDKDNAIAILSSPGSRKVHTFLSRDNRKPVIFMFPGLGGQYVNMGRELYEKEPLFRHEMDHCLEILKFLMGYDIKEILYPSSFSIFPASQLPSFPSSPVSPVTAVAKNKDQLAARNSQPKTSSEKINQTEIAPPLLFAAEYALAKLLMHWGIKPYALIGYSFGEYTAACLAGVFSLEDALALITDRSQLIMELPEGLMVSVPLTGQELEPFINDEISLSIDNGLSCIVSGTTRAIEAFEKKMKENRTMCMRVPQASRAIHSKMMEPILERFEKVVGEIPLNLPQIPYISNVTGKRAGSEVTNPGYWAAHLRSTVQFAAGINELIKEQNAVFLEVGPGRDLSTMMTRYIENNPDQQVLNLIPPSQKDNSDVYFLLKEIGRLWLYGVKINWDEFYAGEKMSRIPLPGYPFEKQRYWIGGDPLKMGRERLSGAASLERKTDMADWFYVPSWEQSILPSPVPLEKQEPLNWLVFTDKTGLGSKIAAVLKQNHQDVTLVEIGETFTKLAEGTYAINHRQSDDYETLFRELHKLDKIPRKILHFWGVTESTPTVQIEELDISQDTGLHSMLNIARAIGRYFTAGDIHVACVTNNIFKVTGEEELYPPKSTILAAVQIIPLEYPNITCRCIDIVHPGAGSQQENVLLENLVSEFLIDSPDIFVAYRGGYRWVENVKPIRLDKPAHAAHRLKKGGVYLITGGFGGMGFTFAQHLAKTYQARLILLGRSPFPPKEEWDEWLASHDNDENCSRKIKKIREWENLGAEIMIASADVADFQRLQAVIKDALQRFGTIDGVLHTAGIIDYGGVIQRRTRDVTEKYMAPKVRGTLVLDTLLKEVALDFMVLFSSDANVLYKTKFGQVSYNAGNEFLEAFANLKNPASKTLIAAINWADWREVGMNINAFNATTEKDKEKVARQFEAVMAVAVSPDEGVAILERILEYPFHRITIATHDLNMMIRVLDRSREQQEEPLADLEATDTRNLQQRPHLTTDYVAPRNQIEGTLEKILKNFFGLEQVGIYDDFFELGGDSLKAMSVISRIHQACKVRVPLPVFFDSPNIEGITRYINAAKTSEYDLIEPAEKKEYYPLSSAQKRIFISEQMERETIGFNQPYVKVLDGDLDMEKLEEIVRQLIKRHEAIRTSFQLIADEPVQVIHENMTVETEYYDLFGENRGEAGDEAVQEIIDRFVRPFDLSQAPLFRIEIIKLEQQKFVLLLDIHHIISDGTSNTLFIRDFVTLAREGELPLLECQYKDYSQWQNSQVQKEAMKRQEEFWLQEFPGELPTLNLPLDYERPTIQTFEGKSITFQIPAEKRKLLQEIVAAEGVTWFMLLLALYNIFLAKICSQADIVVGCVTAGRRQKELGDVMGMFVNVLAIRNFPRKEKTFLEFLKEVKEKTLVAFENQDYQFDDLVSKVVKRRDLGYNPLSQAAFVLQGVNPKDDIENITDSNQKNYQYENRVVKDDLFLEAVVGNRIDLRFEYSTRLFKKETCEKFIDYFKEIASSVGENPERKIKDIEVISQEQKDKLRSEIRKIKENIQAEFQL